MEEWIKCPLGDILNFRRGHDLPKTSMIPGDIPVAGSNGIIGFHNVATPISPCITIGRSGNVGTPYIYDKCWAHNTVLYIDDHKGNDPRYLYYLLKTLPLASFGGGSAVPTLNRNHIHPLEVVFCKDIELQKKIACILSKIDDKIELNRQINDNLTSITFRLSA
jgi:type I restriction enzyme S subunit